VRQADNLDALGFVGGAHCVQGVAFASSSLTPQNRKTFCVGEVSQGVGLFRFQRMGGGGRLDPLLAQAVIIVDGKNRRVALQRHF
jgi:hypothetical protein